MAIDDDDAPLGGQKIEEGPFGYSEQLIRVSADHLQELNDRIQSLESLIQVLLRLYAGQMTTSRDTSELLRRLGELAFGKPKL